MLEKDITEKRKTRHKVTQEDFTPDSVIEQMCDSFPDELYTDFTKTVLDPCSGTGNILLYVIKKRLQYCNNNEDVYKAISTTYGTELMEDNVNDSHLSIIRYISNLFKDIDVDRLKEILEKNIVCTDSFNWDYKNWCPISKALF